MLTWKERKVLKYDDNMNLLETLDLPSEIRQGWGITHFNHQGEETLLVTDGSHKLFHVDP